MDGLTLILLLGLIIFGSHLIEGVTGFGSTVIALPFVTLLLGIHAAVPVLCCIGTCMSFYLVCRSWKSFHFRDFSFILLWCGLGMPLGILAFEKLSADALCLLLGGFMIGAGSQGFLKTLRSRRMAETPAAPAKKTFWMRLVLFAGGFIQGSLGSGGPLVVIYAAKALPDKSVFRVNLSMLWLTLNTWRLIDWTVKGKVWTPEIGKEFLCGLPFMIGGVLLGDWLHQRVSDYIFKLAVYGVLTLAGLVMLIVHLKVYFH